MGRHRLALVGALLVLAGCAPGEQPPDPVPPPSTASTVPTPVPTSPPAESVPELVVGQSGPAGLELDRERLSMSVSTVESSLGTSLFMAPQTEDCSLGVAEDLGIAVVTDDTSAVLAYVIERDDTRTREGIGVGDSIERVRSVYGPDMAAPLTGTQSQSGGPVVVVRDLEQPEGMGNGSLHYAFDTDPGGSVTRIRSGFWPWVAYTDYCSPLAENPQRTGWPLTRGQ